MNILLIEDNPDHADLIMEAAQEAFENQVTIDWHTRFNSGMEKLANMRYDLCLCDLILPDSNASDTTEKLSHLSTRTPLIVLTSLEDESLARKLIHHGVQDYLPKEELSARLLRRIGSYAIERKRYTTVVEAREADKELFCQCLSHDFKGPVRRLLSILQLLRQDLSDRIELTDEEERYFEFLEDNFDSISDLVNSLSQYLTVNIEGEQHQVVDLNNVLSEAKKMSGLKEEEPGVSVNVMPLPSVKGNHSQLVIVFTNLISNAIKFNNGECVVEVSARSDDSNQFCVVDVTDNGIGIEKEYVDSIFLPFKKLHGVGEYSGSGLGLNMVKRIIEHHHGDISVSSSLGHGATFSIRLPFF